MSSLRLPLFACCFPLGLLLGQQPTLRITAPASQAVVHPGDTITVTVEASGAAFEAVIVIPPDPIPVEGIEMRTAPPYKFTVHIPEK